MCGDGLTSTGHCQSATIAIGFIRIGLAKAFKAIRDEFADAELWYSGHYSEDIKQKILHELNGSAQLERRVKFLGLGGLQDLQKLYRSASVTVLPSVWEAFGLVLVESLAAGTPVVGSDHAGIVDIIDSDFIGRCFSAGDFDQASENWEGLAVELSKLLRSPTNEEQRQLCLEHAKKFSWQTLGPVYESWYEKLAS